MREDGGCDQRGILDADAVVDLVAFLEPAQDGDGVLDARLIDHDRLEAALKGGILLDVLAVLVQRGGPDGAEFAAGKLGLEEIGGVHRALGGTRADDGVKLVNEEDDLPLGGGDLLEEGLQAVLELTAELGTRHHRSDVHGDDPLVLERLGNIPADDPPGQTLDDGGLSDARFTDQDGVVLGAAGEDLHGAADLLVAADDRVDLPLAGHLGEVAAVFLKGLVFSLGVLVGDTLAAAHLDQCLHESLVGDSVLLKELRGGVLLLAQGEQVVFGGEELVLELRHLGLGRIDGLSEFVADEGLGSAVHLGQGGRGGLQRRDERLHGDPHLFENGTRQSFSLRKQGKKEMFVADLLLTETGGDVDGPVEGLLHLGCEFVRPHEKLLSWRRIEFDPLAEECGDVEILALHDGGLTLVKAAALVCVEVENPLCLFGCW